LVSDPKNAIIEVQMFQELNAINPVLAYATDNLLSINIYTIEYKEEIDL
jgi:hypothetical protein